MQYGSLDAVLLNSRYLVFLVNDHIPIDILSHLDNHRIQNVSPQSPLSCVGIIADADNYIFEKYVVTPCIPCNYQRKLDANLYSYDSNASASPFFKQPKK
jgi:hypothetical protein